jgi:ornithine decarboxylase
MSLDAGPLEGEAGRRPQQPRFANARAMVTALKPSYPVYCVRPQVVKAAARAFLDEFPGRVLYAVKCNPQPLILRALYDEGIRHFDTASLAEVAQVRELFRDAEC